MVGALDALTLAGSVSTITTTISSIISLISGNEILMVFMCAPVVSIAIGFVKKLVGRM